MGNDEYKETARFCHMLDKFSDCLNIRCIGEGCNKRKPDLEPYKSINDERLEVHDCVIILKSYMVIYAVATK